ncbi:MAG: hypothetical protein JJT85_10110 [Chromatiales bacterium]|nr:hypothetical protein [Chromatiales bacterium]
MAQPSEWIRRYAGLIPPGGRVLDLAAGSGRHSRYLAMLGYRVLAVDRDADALAGLSGLPGIEIMVADLESPDWPLSGLRFSGIVVCNYLHRPRLSGLPEQLLPGGVLLYETFARGHERHGRPRNPEFLLRDGELAQAWGDRLEILASTRLDSRWPVRARREQFAGRRPLRLAVEAGS